MAVRVLHRQCFTVSWLAMGALVWLLPLYLFVYSRLTHHLPNNYEGSIRNRGYNYNNYGNHQQNDDIGWGTYLGANGNDDDDIQWKNYKDNNCSWLFGCEYQSHKQASAPRWWLFGSDEISESSPSLRAALAMVYMGSSLMFAGILYFGFHTAVLVRLDRYQNLDPLLPVLIVFAVFSALTMILIGCIGGMVDTSGREFVKRGWFGQVGILLFVTAFFWIIFSMIFITVIRTGFFRLCFFPLDTIDNYQLHDAPAPANQRPMSPAKTAVATRTRIQESHYPVSPNQDTTPRLKSINQRRWEDSKQAKMMRSRSRSTDSV